MTGGVLGGPDDGVAVDRDAAAAQLAGLQADRVQLADRLVQPWWWDASLGLLLFALLASYSFHDARVTLAVLVVVLAGFGALVAAYKRLSGTWWDARKVGPVQERVRRMMRWWLAGYLALLALGCAAEYLLDLRGTMVAVGAVLGTAAGLLSHRVSRLYAAGLRAGL